MNYSPSTLWELRISGQIYFRTFYRIAALRGSNSRKTTMNDDKYKAKLAKFSGINESCFNLCCLRVWAALSCWELATSLVHEEVDASGSERALAILISALRNKPRRAVQECTMTISEWSELLHRYAAKALINKIGILNTLLNVRLKVNKSLVDQVAKIDSRFARFVTMVSDIEGSMVIAVLLSYVANLQSHTRIIPSIYTMPKMWKWNYVTVVLIEKHRSSL